MSILHRVQRGLLLLTGILTVSVVFGQDAEPLELQVPPSDAASEVDQIDPAALVAPPAFGDSQPTGESPLQNPNSDTPRTEKQDRPPRFHVTLTITPGTGVVADQAVFFEDNMRQVARPEGESTAILLCDHVQVDASADDGGSLTYTISCKGKITLRIKDNTITGDSLTSAANTLTIHNSVVQLGDQAFLQTEKLNLTLPISAVRVQAIPDTAKVLPFQRLAADNSHLVPVPDPNFELGNTTSAID